MKKVLLLCLLLMLPTMALASPGGTDANGGHYNHSTGLYHYHHGYPEHQHENGICPYTGTEWELKIPEKPATLQEWEAQQHDKTETPTIDNETPEDAANRWDDANKATEKGGNPLPAVAGGAAAAAGGAVLIFRRRKRRLSEEAAVLQEEEVVEEEPEMPEDTVIGEDGLPWEKEAYARYLEHKAAEPNDTSVPTNKAEPKWGRKYTFCTDADGEEIHTMDCELAFIQVNAASKHCPKVDCPICHPVRPDLRWFEEAKKNEQDETRSA